MIAADAYANDPLPKIAIDEWTIPDGVIREAPVLDMITLDGQNLEEFDPKTISYERTILYTDTSVPQVGAIAAVGISAWQGTAREYSFSIDVSNDGVNWTEVIAKRTTDTANGENIGIYEFGKVVNAKYMRYNGYGNSVNVWNSLTEIAALKKK